MELSSGRFVKPLQWCVLTKIINMLAPPSGTGKVSGRQMGPA